MELPNELENAESGADIHVAPLKLYYLCQFYLVFYKIITVPIYSFVSQISISLLFLNNINDSHQ